MTPNKEALRRIAEAKATNAEVLDLGDLRLYELPAELSCLSKLRALSLGAYSAKLGVSGVEFAWHGNRLEPGSYSMHRAMGGPRWERFNLDAIQDLSELEQLSTNHCPVTDVSPLKKLPKLKYLDLSNCIDVTDIGPLAALTTIQHLSLSACNGVTDIGPLAALTDLQHLDLSGCKRLTTIAPLAELYHLRYLNLARCETLTDIEALAGLTSLETLDLTAWELLTDLRPLGRLSALQYLSLRCCKSVTDIGPLAAMTLLKRLDLAYCPNIFHLGVLNLLLPSLQYLLLAGSHSEDVPEEICGISDHVNVINRVRAYFADLERGAQDDTELKVFVLGNGGVGKSHLCNRLNGGKYPADPSNIVSTHGVRVEEFSLEIAGSKNPTQVNLWDFGGQDIYHGSHALFLQQRAVFLLLWHPDMERGEFHQGGVTMRHRPSAFWLDYLRNVAGPEAHVLILQSQCDSRGQKRPLPVPLPDDFAFVRALEVSAKTGIGLTELKGALAGAIEELFGKRPPPKIGIGRVEMRRQIREMASTNRTITVAEFHDLCTANGKISDADALLDFFHECGVVFYRTGMFDNRIILDQNWALAAIYTLLDRGKTLPAINNSGRFTRTDLQHLIWQDKSDTDCDALLGMMQSCGICFKARDLKLADGKTLTQYIAPELLPRWSESLVPMFRRLLLDPKYLGFEERYPFLHDGILRGFLSRLGNIAGDHAVYWKYGCWFHEQHSDCDVFIDSRWDETGEYHSRGSLTVKAWGRNPEEVLLPILKLLHDRRIVQTPKTIYINFPGFINVAYWDWRESIHHEILADKPLIVSAPGTRTALPENLGKQVYLSYAWGEDETEIGRQREAAARRSIERLKEAGYEVTYDKKEMKPGDLISDFIRRIGTARRVVSIISKKYLESPYCIKELYCIFLHSLRDKKLFLGRIHPLILQDARLSDVAMLKQYRAYWTAKKEEYQNLFPHGAEGGVLSAVEIEHWILDMMTVLSFLTDKLSVVVSDGDFERMIDAVLEMLERTETDARQ